MKTSTNYALVIIAALVFASHGAFAVGTPAGTIIQTQSKVVYSTVSGLESDTVYSNLVSFTVAQVAAANMTPATNSSTTTSDSVFADYPLTIVNSGNGTDIFNITSTSTKGWTRVLYFDANGDGVLQEGEVSGGAITQTADIVADSSYAIIVRVVVPRSGSLNGQTDTTVVTVVSVFDGTKTNTAQVLTTVNTVNIPAIGTALSVTPTNPSPGQNVTYSMTLTNTGSVPATNVSFTDMINTGMFSYVSHTTSQGTFSNAAPPATWTVGTINPGGSVTVSITLLVLPLPNGTVLTNSINVTYTVGVNTFTVTSNTPYAAVGVVRGVQISPTAFAASQEAEDTLSYAITVKNTGNSNDILELSYSSSRAYTWLFFKDINGNGVYNTGDTPLTDAAGSTTGVDVDSVASSDSVKIVARLIVPKESVDQTEDVTTFTVKSDADPSKFQSAIATTTVNVPALSIVRVVTPSGNQPPGEEMTFEVTYQNTGNGSAYNVTVTETEPDSMTYVPNSVTINNISKTDAADADEVTVTTAGGKKVITISLGTIAGISAQGVIRYRATIH
ncbi:MAG: hypothetical protein ACYC09_08020 [Bacteroidota bacterium]